MASSAPSVQEILDVLWEMGKDERAEVRDALALERVGDGGSPPMSAITRAGPSEKVWMYTEDDDERMLENDWMVQLNAAGDSETHEVKFQFHNRWNHGFEVDLEAMTFKNQRSEKEGPLYPMEMIVLDVPYMLEKRSLADIEELAQGGWMPRWQHTDPSGWKNMSVYSNSSLLSELVALKDVTVLTEHWKSWSSGAWNQITYDVDFKKGTQISRNFGNKQREVRLVAVREWERK